MAKRRTIKRRHRRHNPKHRAGVRLFNRGPRRSRRRRPNPRLRIRRRRNPNGAVVLTRPGSYLPQMVTGALAASAVVLAPALVWRQNVNGWWAYGTQAVVAGAGGLLVPFVARMAGVANPAQHGLVWLIVGGATILADSIGKSLIGSFFGVKNQGVGQYALRAPYYPTRMAPNLGQVPGMTAYGTGVPAARAQRYYG